MGWIAALTMFARNDGAKTLCCLLVSFGLSAIAAPAFPELTGRVVDDAHVLSRSAVDYLTQRLAGYEAGTGNQIAVVTLPALNGDSIENYSNLLFRHWGLGQKGKDNGVLLAIVPGERKLRIEVGDRLEPVLTDVITSRIINDIIIPDFKDGDTERGIVDGTQAIMTALGGHEIHNERYRPHGEQQPASMPQTILGFIALVFFLIFAVRHPFLTMLLLSNSRFGSSGGGSDWNSGGDNFRGGGGSASGGGASGSW